MKSSWLAVLAVCLVLGAGCKKKEPASEWKTVGAVRLSLPELQQALEVANAPEIQRSLNELTMAIRYGKYTDALAALERLTANPGLSAKQKKLADDVAGQVKQLAAKAQARPAH